MSYRLRPLRPIFLFCAAAAMAGPVAAQQPAAPQAAPPPAAQAPAPAQKPPAKPPAAAAAAPAAQPLKDPVVATVNGQPIRLSELEIAQQALPQQYRNMPLQAVFPALLDRIVDSKLVVQEGKKNKVTDDPAFKKRMAFVEDQVLQDFWIQREVARKVTPEKLQQRYEERLKSMPSEEEVHARHILVSTEDEAKALIADNVRTLAEEVRQGRDIVVPGPTCSYMLKQEYPWLDGSEDANLVAGHTRDLFEYMRATMPPSSGTCSRISTAPTSCSSSATTARTSIPSTADPCAWSSRTCISGRA